MNEATVLEDRTAVAGRLERRVERRPTEAEARAAIESWLDGYAPGYPDYSLCEDGDEDSAQNKCGWAFWVAPEDTTSYVHEDLTIEWYGTGWPDDFEYDENTGNWRELPPNAKIQGPGGSLPGPAGNDS